MIVLRQTISETLAEFDKQSLESWLTESERFELTAWREAARTSQWLAGRWLAKRELAPLIDATPLEIDIASRDTFGRGTVPRVCVRGRTWPGSLSISHAGEHVAVAIDSRHGHRIGIDVVVIQDRAAWSDGALETCFSDDEQAWIRTGDNLARRAARLWAVKEATYKATQRGESFAPSHWPALKWLTDKTPSPLELAELDDAVIAVVAPPITPRLFA